MVVVIGLAFRAKETVRPPPFWSSARPVHHRRAPGASTQVTAAFIEARQKLSMP